MSVEIITCIIALAGIYLYGMLISLLIDIIGHKKSTKTPKKTTFDNIRLRANRVIESDPRVKKIYVTLRVMHLKNKKSNQIDLLEQQLRTLVREKAVRQEILHMVRAKVIMK